MDYRCRIYSLSNSSTASGSSDPGGTAGPSFSQAVGTFISAIFVSFHNRSSRLTFFVCFYVLFHSCCFHSHVFGKTLEHEFHFSCSRSEWNLHSLLSENGDEICKQSAVKLNFKLTSNTGGNQRPILLQNQSSMDKNNIIQNRPLIVMQCRTKSMNPNVTSKR